MRSKFVAECDEAVLGGRTYQEFDKRDNGVRTVPYFLERGRNIFSVISFEGGIRENLIKISSLPIELCFGMSS